MKESLSMNACYAGAKMRSSAISDRIEYACDWMFFCKNLNTLLLKEDKAGYPTVFECILDAFLAK